MAKIKLKASTFNGIDINPSIELFIQKDLENKNLPLQVYSEIKNRLKNELKLKNEEVCFNIESKDLQELNNKNIQIDNEYFTQELYKIVKDEYLKQTGQINNEFLKRAIILFEERDIDGVNNILGKIDISSLSIYEINEFIFLQFKLSDKKDEKDFRLLLSRYENNPAKLKEIYFTYIKYLEDIRDEKKPYDLIVEFENRFSLDNLSKEEEALYYYLIGRNNYLRGEFLGSLINLKEALTLTKNEKMLANIYNTATNCYTDNMFFEEALNLANKALEIRELLKLPQKYDTYSLIGGIYQKSSQYKKALEYFKKANKGMENSRIYNYLAKASIMTGNKNGALEYIEKAKSFNDDKKGFTKLIELLYLYKIESYDGAGDFFIEQFVNPDNNQNYDKFVLAWAYSIKSQISFEKKLYEEGIKALSKAIDYFLFDKYILESFYVYLYPFCYDLPKKEIEKFLILVDKYSLNRKVSEYITKHKTISDKYNVHFKIPKGKNNLLEFYEKTKNINPVQYNSLALKKLINSYNFI